MIHPGGDAIQRCRRPLGDHRELARVDGSGVSVERRAIEAAGATLRQLPPYSPGFNPIENAFSKLKAFPRKAAAHTIGDLWDAIRNALPTFTPQDYASYFTAAGYEDGTIFVWGKEPAATTAA